MEAGLDTGPVLLTKKTPINADDTTQTLHDRLATLGAAAITEALDQLRRGAAIDETPQASVGVTYAQKIAACEAMIDWSAPAAYIERAVRAYTPAPGAATLFRGERIKLWRARLAIANDVPLLATLKPGTLIRQGSSDLAVVCGDSGATGQLLVIEEIQRPGGKRAAISGWLSSPHAPATGDVFFSTESGD